MRVCFKSAGRKNARFCAFFGVAESKLGAVSRIDSLHRTGHTLWLVYA